MDIKKRSDNIRRLILCAMFSALGVVILYLGSIIDVLDIAMAALVSLFVIFAVIEYGGAAPWCIYAVTGLLSAILLPNKFPAIMYIFFFGFYPIIKEKAESRRSRALAWGIKEIVFNISLVIMIALSNLLMSLKFADVIIFEAVFFILANGVFVIYDIALTRLISAYLFRFRKNFKIK